MCEVILFFDLNRTGSNKIPIFLREIQEFYSFASGGNCFTNDNSFVGM